MTSLSVEEIFAGQTPGYTLSQALHLDPDIYQLELDRIWRTNWLFAAHTAELRQAGDRTVFDVGYDSALIVRGEDGQLRAFHNVCRHRGSRLVDETIATFAAALPYAAANSRPPDPFIRCPYHQWAYRLDGSLAACGGMDRMAGFNTREHGLWPLECAEVGGLVFVRFEPPSSRTTASPCTTASPWTTSSRTTASPWNTASFRTAPSPRTAPSSPGPPDPAPDIHELGDPLSPQRLEKAKVAYSQTYSVGAGWKVVWENNRECWHCHVGHPEYIRSHFDTANTASADVQQQIAARTATMVDALSGLSAGDVYDGGGLATFPSPGRAWSVHRTPLVEGFATESLDGQPVAPLMGEYKSFDVGVLRLRALPNFWCHASADHAVTTRLAPAGLDTTEVVVTWLVDEEAVEDRDYSLEELLPVWERTSEQDWQLCERNQRGIRSSGYRPGPLSDRHEANVAAFHNWYREAMAGP